MRLRQLRGGVPRRLQLGVLALVAVVTLLLVVVTFVKQGSDAASTPGPGLPSTAPESAGPTAGTATRSASTSTAARVLLLGDDYASGTPDNRPTWATLLAQKEGWDTTIDAQPGTGYVSHTSDAQAVPERAAADLAASPASVVIVAVGYEDAANASPAEVAAAATKTLDQIKAAQPDASVVMLSPFSPGKVASVTDVHNALRTVAAQAKVPFVEVTNAFYVRQSLIGPDGVSPTSRGQAFLAGYVAEQLAKVKISGLPLR